MGILIGSKQSQNYCLVEQFMRSLRPNTQNEDLGSYYVHIGSPLVIFRPVIGPGTSQVSTFLISL